MRNTQKVTTSAAVINAQDKYAMCICLCGFKPIYANNYIVSVPVHDFLHLEREMFTSFLFKI
jgi:hypothetical protein